MHKLAPELKIIVLHGIKCIKKVKIRGMHIQIYFIISNTISNNTNNKIIK